MMENVFPLNVMLSKIFLPSSDRFILFTSMSRFSLNSIDTKFRVAVWMECFPFPPYIYCVSRRRIISLPLFFLTMNTVCSFFHRYLNLLHLQKAIAVYPYADFKCVIYDMICQGETWKKIKNKKIIKKKEKRKNLRKNKETKKTKPYPGEGDLYKCAMMTK